jgi:hypothetical protein
VTPFTRRLPSIQVQYMTFTREEITKKDQLNLNLVPHPILFIIQNKRGMQVIIQIIKNRYANNTN